MSYGIQKSTRFDHRLYLALPQGNLMCSTFSAKLALGRTTVGARGETREQMLDALGIPAMDDKSLMLELIELEQNLHGLPGLDLRIVNSIFLQKDYPLREEFRKLMLLGAGFESVDFIGNPNGSRTTINSWAANQTEDRILELLPNGSIDTMTRMVLANALYLKAQWARKFLVKNTKTLPFFYEPNRSVDADIMHQTGQFGYADLGRLQALRLPYVGNRIVMDIYLPKEGGSLLDIEQQLFGRSNELLNSINSYLRYGDEKVHVRLPRWQTTWGSFPMKEVLQALGMTHAFSDELADFSGMEEEPTLKIANAYQKTFIKTDEEGTEAAASTAVVMAKRAMLPQSIPTFNANRPFAYIIRDLQTGVNLFMGRLANPAAV